MKLTFLKSMIAAVSLLTATVASASGNDMPVENQLIGTWFVEVTGVLPSGGAYQNIMNVDAGGTADIVGGWMFGAGGVKFTDSPASVISANDSEFEIHMFAFIVDAESGAPSGLNITVYRGTMDEGGRAFSAEADLYYLPCSVEHCPAPNPENFGTPATVAQVTGLKIATPLEIKN